MTALSKPSSPDKAKVADVVAKIARLHEAEAFAGTSRD
jgi:hypothetical protein